MLVLIFLRGRDGFKGAVFSGQLLLNCAMAAILAGNRWAMSGRLLRKSGGFGHNRAIQCFAQKTNIQPVWPINALIPRPKMSESGKVVQLS